MPWVDKHHDPLKVFWNLGQISRKACMSLSGAEVLTWIGFLSTIDLWPGKSSPLPSFVNCVSLSSFSGLQKARFWGSDGRDVGRGRGFWLPSFSVSSYQTYPQFVFVCFVHLFFLFFSISSICSLASLILSSGFSSGPEQQLNPQLRLWSKWGTDNWLHMAFAPGTQYLIYSWLS